MTIYFDITTSISWGGAQVGITRVEREIARRAARFSTNAVRFCVYNAASGRYYELTKEFAEAVLERGWWVDLDVMRNLALNASKKSRSSVLDDLTVDDPARAILKLHAKSTKLSLAEILVLRTDNPMAPVHAGDEVRLLSISQIVKGVVPLNPSTWIVNGGLDWEHKNLRHLRLLKAKTGFKYAAIIYDIIPLLFPHYVVPFYVDLLKRYFGELFWTADIGLCISATTRRDVEKHLERWRMPGFKLVDWPLGSDFADVAEQVATVPRALSGRRFLLYVSTIEPRKSHRTIVEAFEYGINNGTVPNDAMCVFVGRVGWNCENLIEEIRNNPKLADRVLILSGISDADLNALYAQARFVVFPSRYEGYGLSLVEAMALGKACLSGDAGSLKEVGGDAPLYIDPIDIPEWSRAIAECFVNDEKIAALEARSRSNYQPVTWDDSARRFFALLDAAIGADK